MLTRERVYSIARETVIGSISGFINKKSKRPKFNNFQILDIVIPTERSIRSLVGGMETSLGTTLWEPLAKAIAIENGFTIVTENLEAPVYMPANIQNILQNLIEGRNLKEPLYSATYCHKTIKETCQSFVRNPINNFKLPSRGFGVDIWLKRDNINYFFDTKTVQPNVGAYSKYFSQILNWYAYFYSRFPTENAVAKIVFPYNPYGDNIFWDKTIGKGWPLEPHQEGWVENEFWNFCSGLDGTFEIIKEAFKNIAEEGDLEEVIQEVFYGVK